ncbi:MAG TPA: M36 family metallopeptidase [Pseudomonadota bacterium]|nr:M36 family metallopeptidase [Pseudomonadota bacterium]
MKKIWFRSRLILGTAALLYGCGGEPAAPPAVLAPTPGGPALEVDAHVAHRDRSVNLPTLSWLQPRRNVPIGSAPKDVALGTLRGLAQPYRLSEAALGTAQLRTIHDSGNGPLIAHFDQKVDGMEVFRSSMKIGMDRGATPVVASGYLAPQVRPITQSFSLDETAAVAAAFHAMQNGKVVVNDVHRTRNIDDAAPGPYASLAVAGSAASGETMVGPARSKRLWYPTTAGLLPAYYVELTVGRNDSTDSKMVSFVVSAVDGEILFTKDLTEADAFTYRVWADTSGRYTPWDSPAGNDFTPHPTGLNDSSAPGGVLPAALVKLQNAPFNRRNDPWLPADASDTDGNNVFAYADLAAPDGFGPGDVRVTTTSAQTFDRVFDSTEDAAATTAAAVGTHLFYVLNYMHDFFYEAGWDEISNNQQKDNFGRGGLGGDAIRAEAQDSGGTNNANASTPADGNAPRIQMYLWTPAFTRTTITAPAGMAGMLVAGAAQSSPRTYNVSADVVLVNDGSAAPTTGCAATFANAAAVAGKIALVDRGGCNFTVKIKNAQVNGAVGTIIANNAAGAGAFGPGGTDPTITIPGIGISLEDGVTLKAALAGTVTMRLVGGRNVRDGSIDTGIVAHEWGHTMSNRLIGNASGLSSLQGRGMGEGWSDFVAMLTTVRPEDAAVAANANWNGVYPVGAWAEWAINSPIWYEGIRRYPYSADMSKNPLTFKHIEDDTALPTTPAPAYGADGADNSEVHNTGEVWNTMLWDCYVAMLRDTARYTFEQANLRMRQYLVAGLKMTPNAPTILEARDALLAAVYATDQQDFQLFWKAFARRGAGIGALGPDRSDQANSPVTESFIVGNDLSIESITVTDSVKSCDRDGVLDNNETGVVSVRIHNEGSGDLAATTVKLTSSSANVTFKGQATTTLNVPTIRPAQSVTVTAEVAMAGAAALTPYDIQVDVDEPTLQNPRTITRTYQGLGQFDDVVKTSAIGNGNFVDPAWTVANSTDPALESSFRWEILPGPRASGVWHCPDHDGEADHYLITPPLQVNAAGNFDFTVTHRYQWEYDDSVTPFDYYDGSVIEISDDAGKTWTDLGPKMTMGGYNATLVGGTSANPLAGQMAFGGESTNFEVLGVPGYVTTTVELGTAYAGKTVRVRFRGGTDQASGFSGWFVQQVAFNNLQNTPFGSRVADRGLCVPEPTSNIVIKASSDAARVPSGYRVQLLASTVEDAGKPVTFTWSQVSGPQVSLSSTTEANPQFSAPTVTADTPVVFQVVGSDGTAQSSAQMVTITVITAGSSTGTTDGSGGCSCHYGGQMPLGSSVSDLLLAGMALFWSRRRRK